MPRTDLSRASVVQFNSKVVHKAVVMKADSLWSHKKVMAFILLRLHFV